MIIGILTISMAGLLNGCTNENVNIGNTLQNSSVLDKVIDIISEELGYKNGNSLNIDSEFVIRDDWARVYIGSDEIDFEDDDCGVACGLEVANFLTRIEKEWDLKIPGNEAENFKTVGDIVNYIEKNK